MEFTLSEYDLKNSNQIESSPLGLLFLEMYLSKFEKYMPEEELEWIEQRLIESDLELNRQRKRVHFLNDETSEHCSHLFSNRRGAPDDLRIPDWIYDYAEI